jgi:hypothetical protein
LSKNRYRALNNREDAANQRGEKGDFTELFEGEVEAQAVQIGGEVRPAGSYSGEASLGRQYRGEEELE